MLEIREEQDSVGPPFKEARMNNRFIIAPNEMLPGLASVIDRVLDNKLSKRVQTAEEMLKDVENVLARAEQDG